MYVFDPTEPPRHVDKTEQDRMPVSGRRRVAEWLARQQGDSSLADIQRRYDLQYHRIASGHFAHRHLNGFIRAASVVAQ